MPFILDISASPLLVVTYPAVATLADIEHFIAATDVLFARAAARREHIATVADLSQVRIDRATSEMREALAHGLATIDARYAGVAVCDAVVSTSPMMRAFVAAHSALRRRRSHITRTFASMAEARAWADLTLRASRHASQPSVGA